ncbi:S-layer homology domain-containing protein [Paenibacillus daejeonensis]|uniref:S-layer homology domain-containing protein n=1 Tax=Paenibacillus daejeonensis TaxID=135193 RepID=UPI00036D174C|nr:S-layer homology domain-containing protein [Paenibacillus daejeonensis]
MSHYQLRKVTLYLMLAVMAWWPAAPWAGMLASGSAHAAEGRIEAVSFDWRALDTGGAWTISFVTSSSGVVRVFDSVHLTAPQGLLTGRDIYVNVGGSRLTVSASSVRYSGNTLSFSSPHLEIGPSTYVEIEVLMSTRPQPGTYPGSVFAVATQADPAPVSPQGPVVVAKLQPSMVQDVSFQAMPPQLGAVSQWVVRFRTSPDGLLTTGLETITLLGPSGTRFSDDPAHYTVNGVVVDRLEALEPHQVTLRVPANALSLGGREYVVLASGTGNPAEASPSVAYAVSTSLDVMPAHPEVPIAWLSMVEELALQVEPPHARMPGRWEADFVATSGLAAGDSITLEAPAGTQFPDHAAAYELDGRPVAGVNVYAGGRQVVLTVPASAEGGSPAEPGSRVNLSIEGVTNPSAGDYGGEALRLQTTRDPLQAMAESGPVFRNEPVSAVASVRMLPETTDAEAASQWVVHFHTGPAGALRRSVDTITLTLPEGSRFAEEAGAYRVNGVPVSTVDVTAGHRVRVTVPLRIGDNEQVELVAPVIRAPAAGYYPAGQFRVETSVDVAPGSPPAGLVFGVVPLPAELKLSAEQPTVHTGTQTTLVLTATDGEDSPVPGASIEWAATAGELRPRAAVTDKDGRIMADYTAPAEAGPITVTAKTVHGIQSILTLEIVRPQTPPPWVPPVVIPPDPGAEEPEGGQESPEPEPSPEPPEGEAEPTLPSFVDLAGHWAEGQIRQAAGLGIVRGYPDGTFWPERQVTRAELAVMLSGAGLHNEGPDWSTAADPDPYSARERFTDGRDIPGWAADAVSEAVHSGIFVGYEDGSFRPGAPITRAELAVILYRLAGHTLESPPRVPVTFADVEDIPGWAAGPVEAVRQLGLITGREGLLFAPQAAATRAESTVTLIRLLDISPSD